jgi:hypothetical protein
MRKRLGLLAAGCLLAAAVVSAVSPGVARAEVNTMRDMYVKSRPRGEWSNWRSVGGKASGTVEVRTCEMGKDVWTWQFKNISQDYTVTYMRFLFVDKDGQHINEMKYPLQPAGIYGGSDVYTASSDPNGQDPTFGIGEPTNTTFNALEIKTEKE